MRITGASTDDSFHFISCCDRCLPVAHAQGEAIPSDTKINRKLPTLYRALAIHPNHILDPIALWINLYGRRSSVNASGAVR